MTARTSKALQVTQDGSTWSDMHKDQYYAFRVESADDDDYPPTRLMLCRVIRMRANASGAGLVTVVDLHNQPLTRTFPIASFIEQYMYVDGWWCRRLARQYAVTDRVLHAHIAAYRIKHDFAPFKRRAVRERTASTPAIPTPARSGTRVAIGMPDLEVEAPIAANFGTAPSPVEIPVSLLDALDLRFDALEKKMQEQYAVLAQAIQPAGENELLKSLLVELVDAHKQQQTHLQRAIEDMDVARGEMRAATRQVQDYLAQLKVAEGQRHSSAKVRERAL